MNKGQHALQLKAEGKSNAEIAELLGMPKPSVRRLIAEAKDSANVAWQGSQEATAPYLTFDVTGAGRGNPTVWLNGKLIGEIPNQPAPKSLIVIPDTQCKPGTDLSYMAWAGRYIAERKPDIVVHLGDNWDMPSLSSYEQKGSKWFEGRRYCEDVEAGNKGLQLLTEAMGDFRPKRMVLLRGNHEDRITRAINADPKLEGLIGYHQFNDIALGWEVVDYLVPIEIEGVTFSHYFYQPMSGRPYSGTVENILKNVGFSFIAGHQQGLRFARRELANGRVHIGIIAGSYYIEPEIYRGPQATAEWRGLVVCHELRDGQFDPMFVSMGYVQNRYS